MDHLLFLRVEDKELGITCGYADRYVPLFGGIAYLDYRGKLFQKTLGDEPFVTYERLDLKGCNPSLVAISTGIIRDSGDVHGRLRPRYLQEHRAWATPECAMPPMVDFMHGAWETAWRGKIALLKGDWVTFGALMTQNHQWVNQMMQYCGFEQGAGWANNHLIETALSQGALGAKLTGAGGGGSVFALVHPGQEASLMEAWRETARQIHLDAAQVYQVRVVQQGLEIIGVS